MSWHFLAGLLLRTGANVVLLHVDVSVLDLLCLAMALQAEASVNCLDLYLSQRQGTSTMSLPPHSGVIAGEIAKSIGHLEKPMTTAAW